MSIMWWCGPPEEFFKALYGTEESRRQHAIAEKRREGQNPSKIGAVQTLMMGSAGQITLMWVV
eukprot:7505806-Ditylum_brightwellii.AAC.1